MGPSEKAELSHVVPLDQGEDEPDEADAVQAEGYEAVVRHQETEVVLEHTYSSRSRYMEISQTDINDSIK